MLQLWATRAAPVVRWSDSEIDLNLARSPFSALRSVPGGHHRIKPAFILFLKFCQALSRHRDPGRVIVLANLLLWLAAIAFAAALTVRSRGKMAGWGLAFILLSMLRFRDNASAVMSEALAAALLLTILAAVLAAARIRAPAAAALAIALSVLVWTRPNIGFVAIALAATLGSRKTAIRPAVVFLALLAAINLGVWASTRPPSHAAAFSGYDYPIAEGSIDYAWDPQLGVRLEADESLQGSRDRLDFARVNWRRLFERGLSPDAFRQWSWRAFHGLLGVDYYDSSWSRPYSRIDQASREAGLGVVIFAVAILLTSRRQPSERFAGILLMGVVVAQDLVFSSESRLVVPFIPAILLLAARAAQDFSTRRAWAASGMAAVLASFCVWQPEVLDWPWGRIEKSEVEIVQKIPRGALPVRVPATFHLRMASPSGASSAQFSVAIGGTPVYRSDADRCRTRPEITIALPDEVLQVNRRSDLDLAVTSFGKFDATNDLLFPVIPRPWRPIAWRTGSAELSPSTGMISGSLDWWAHKGAENVPCPTP